MTQIWADCFTRSGLLYKKRIARPGGGKSGGYRTVLSARIGNRYVFLHGFQVCNAYQGGMEAAARVTCPVTMVLGRNDIMTPPRATRDLAAALKARVVHVPSGHHQLAEAPDETLAAVREALA